MLIPSAVGRISVPPTHVADRRERRAAARAERRAGPSAPAPGAPGAELGGGAWLAAGLRGLMGFAQDTCRLRAVSPTLHLVEYATPDAKRMAVHGVHTCKSPLCPYCAPKWQRTRSDEITQAIDNWELGADGVYFVTLTMRHNRRMALSLQHRLLTAAYGALWGGKQGGKAAALLGGKPESVRAHDRTWSRERGWHPHVHSLLFTGNAELDEKDLARLLDRRWPRVLGAALRRMRSLCRRVLTGSSRIDFDGPTDEYGSPNHAGGCGRADCRVCQLPFQGPRRELAASGPLRPDESRRYWRDRPLGSWPLGRDEQRGECWHFRERATRLFGVRLVPRTRKQQTGLRPDGSAIWSDVAVPLRDSVLRILHMLEPFTASSIRPTKAHGAFVERMRSRDRLPNYLAKLGLELASSLDKLGRVDSGGVRHFGHWEVARLASSPEQPLCEAARKAYSQLFWATRGTQTITFSDREALGLGADPYADGQEPSEQRPDEVRECIGIIQAPAYRERVEAAGHGVVAELAGAYARGELAALPYVEPPGVYGAGRLVVFPGTGPPATADPDEARVDSAGYLETRPDPGARGAVLSIAERLGQVEAGDVTIVGESYRRATALPSSEVVLPGAARRRLREAIGVESE